MSYEYKHNSYGYIRFPNIPKRGFTFTLGHIYSLPARTNSQNGYGWEKRLVKFIKTTKKGFNLLDLTTNKCVVMGAHLYSRKWSHKDIPRDVKTFKVKIPNWLPEPCFENVGETSEEQEKLA